MQFIKEHVYIAHSWRKEFSRQSTFKELFKEMTQADKAAANKNKNKNNEGDWQEKGRKKGGSGAGKGGKGKGGKGGKGGKSGGRKKGKGK